MLTGQRLSQISNVLHGFSTRRGGVSGGPFAGLNLGPAVGDDPEHVRENRRRFLRALGPVHSLRLAEVHQVHGREVVLADEAGPRSAEGDALSTRSTGIALGIRTADCAPILIARVIAGRAVEVAAVHAGWRGATLGILEATISTLEVSSLAELEIAIGPAIGASAFEVGEEVIEAARASVGGEEPPHHRAPDGKPHLDLRGLLQLQLVRLGVPEGNVELVGGCTASAPELYFSHRRDRGRTGRHLSAIAMFRG